MRGVMAGLLTVVVTMTVRAGEQEKALVEKAVQAHGGADALTRARRAVRSAEGTLTTADVSASFRDEITTDLPERWRYEGTVGRTRLLMVVNAEGGWQATGGTATELTGKRLAELREEIYVSYLGTLVPLLKEERFKLAALDPEQVHGRKALGVKVNSEGHADVHLYFDAESSLLVKAAVPKAQRGGINVKMEYLYSEHKEFDGVKRPTKQVEMLNGRTFSEIKQASYKFPTKLDDRLFSRP